MLEAQLEARKKQELALAAKALLAEYWGDAELTAFNALDTEDFLL